MRTRVVRVDVVPMLLVLALSAPAPARAQTTPVPPPTATTSNGQSGFWTVAGVSFAAARAGCPECDRDGVYSKGPALMLDLGLRVTPRLDIGVEVLWTRSKIVDELEDSILTTFVMGVAQVRPWIRQGFFFKAGMGAGFVGNGLASPIGWDLKPPFTTNTLGLTYGVGWVFQRERRFTVQAFANHHVAALGELTTVDNTTIKNVVANVWTTGLAFVFR